jgi:3-hydroxyacyl-[acyl-carrier-protein] dehydratase
MNWYIVKKKFFAPSKEISATVTVPNDSPWFSGHFPGNPILPAIAQVSIVFDMICKAIKEPITLKTFSRVKFRRIILPDEEMDITASQIADTPEKFSFRIAVKGEVACKGMMHTNISKVL